MPDFQFILYQKRDHIAYVTINRPAVLNSVHGPASEELHQAFLDFEGDADALVAIFTGAGERAFSAGNDLKYSAETAARGEGFIRHDNFGGLGGMTNPRFQLSKPVIAAVNGFALGGGLEMALASDIIIAADHAQLGLPEPKVGLMASAGGVHRLPRMLPLKVAMGFMLTGRFMSAPEAHRWGLVNEVVAMADLIPTAERWAGEIMECAPLSVRATKQSAMMGLDLPLDAAVNQQFYWAGRMQQSPDYTEGPKAFAEKRKPVWTGR